MFGGFPSWNQGNASGSAFAGAPPAENPHQPASGSHNQPTQVQSHVQEPPLVTVTSDLPEYGGSPSPRPNTAPQQQSASSTPGRARIEVVLSASPNRPPGHKLWEEADLQEDELCNSDVRLTPGKKRKLGPGDRTNPTAAAAAADSSNLIKKRGRPKGWRPGMPSYATVGKSKSSTKTYAVDEHGHRIPASAAGPGKRRGRPPRAPPPTARMVWEGVEPPAYVPFLCEWVGCKAELQNADTLRRHVRKVHGPLKGQEEEGLACLWGNCGREQAPGQEKVFVGEEFHAHMEKKHLVPLVWHLGDGPKNDLFMGSSTKPEVGGEKIPAYLLGPDGKQVTPWVKYQHEEDNMTRMRNRNRLRQILFQRDENAPMTEEDEMELARRAAEGSAPL